MGRGEKKEETKKEEELKKEKQEEEDRDIIIHVGLLKIRLYISHIVSTLTGVGGV